MATENDIIMSVFYELFTIPTHFNFYKLYHKNNYQIKHFSRTRAMPGRGTSAAHLRAKSLPIFTITIICGY